jgi:hypothetical protein
MTRGQMVIYLGPPAAALVLVCLYEASCETIGDGSISVTVTIHSRRPFQLQRVTYGHFGQKAAADESLRNPQDNDWAFLQASVEGPDSFHFEVPFSDHTSPFRVLKNRSYWRPFAVFRIETTDGGVRYVGTEVPDVRTTNAITIDMPQL